MASFCGKLRGLDLFGSGFTMQIDSGRRSLPSTAGAILTLLIGCIAAIYTYQRM